MATAHRLTTLRSLRRSPLPFWAVALMTGQAVGALGCDTLADWPLPLMLGIVFLARARRWRAAGAIALALLGAAQAENLRQPRGAAHIAARAPATLRLRATVVERSDRDGGKLRLLLDVDEVRDRAGWTPAHGLVQLTIAAPSAARAVSGPVDARQSWEPGARIEVEAPLKAPRNFGNPGEFDYEAFLARRRIYVTGFLLDDAGMIALERPPMGWIDDWRARVRGQLVGLATPARELLAALILGEMGALPQRVRDEFAAAGVSHVLSISGLHVALVAGCAYAACRWLLGRSRWLLLRTKVPVLAAAISLLPVSLYAELAQAGVATWRSLVMLALVVAAVLVGRRGDLCVSLAAAALLVSLIWPAVVLDVSFQLSFVSVLALVLAMERYWHWWSAYSESRLLHLRSRAYRWLGWGLASMVVNVSALVATAPLTAFHFNQVSPVAVLANPLVVPLLGTAAVALGLAGALAALVCEPLAHWILVAAAAVAQCGAWITAAVATLPGAGMRVVTPTVGELAVGYAAIGAAVLLAGRARRRVLVLCLALAVADAAREARQRFWRSELRIGFLSVGQGASAVIEFPGSAVMVVDGGGLHGLDTGERLVAPYLWQRKIGRIDYLVLSHPDYDHYGGLVFLAAQFSPREFWHSGVTSDSPSYARLRAAVRDGGSREIVAAAGETREIGGCRVDVLWPPHDLTALAENDTSLVLRIECGSFSALLPGDLQAAGEAGLLASGVPLRSAVVAAGHHGSRTSSTPAFLAAVQPRAAVVSAGYRNRFGFPDAGVLRRLAVGGTEVYRTDLDGAVLVRVSRDGEFSLETSFHGR